MYPLKFHIGDFSVVDPSYCFPQDQLLAFLVTVFAEAAFDSGEYNSIEDAITLYTKLFNKYGGGRHIENRYSYIKDFGLGYDDWKVFDKNNLLTLGGWEYKSKAFNEFVSIIFDKIYSNQDIAPSNIVHVTCTSYQSPSAGQVLCSNKEWYDTKVTQVYHHGCYASIPALRVSQGLAYAEEGDRAVIDIVHTELHTIHADPSRRTIDQIVGHCLFGDGVISYKLWTGESGHTSESRSLEVLAIDEYIIPNSSELMKWSIVSSGMHMVLDKDIPNSIATCIKGFVEKLYTKAGLDYEKDFNDSILAIHPGGPKILDKIRDSLEIDESRMHWSRELLLKRGNLSSASVPHMLSSIVNSNDVASGSIVLCIAFGPGLTAAGSIMLVC